MTRYLECFLPSNLDRGDDVEVVEGGGDGKGGTNAPEAVWRWFS